ncbi:hypothetical protein BFJ63_vAg16676 [Fusarium oxysporum f. sp. narcissi]|uniref:Uncharacterized protein n=1 Tax=Fusarium oxysporum f. sp. narcissi TaxID=451672 RepID=A0A4Q2V2N8_FUSOX|nr:hypothetical protein BFJ63_vAg16676 [Fusarium oxysporum f. sp. narcissi]
MATDLAEALASADLSWQGNYTTGDKRWKLKQLHSLYQLIIDHRDEIIASLSTSIPKHVHEQEFARLVGDISQHISLVSEVGSHSSTEFSFVGKFDVVYRPVGRNLIVSGHVNPVRWILGPLAASLADGNVTIIATTTRNKAFVSFLSREWHRYLDRDSVFLTTSFAESELDLDEIDKATIYGQFVMYLAILLCETFMLTRLPLTDTSIDAYRNILSSPKVRFVETSDVGLNAVLISEGKKLWPQIGNEIERALNLEVSDRLHVVFVREEDAKPLEAALKQSVTTVALSDLVGKQAGTDLGSRIELVKEEGSLLVVVGKSLEGFADALIRLSNPIAQLAILGPHASKVYEFVRRWVPTRLVSVDSICPIALPGMLQLWVWKITLLTSSLLLQNVTALSNRHD